MSSHFPFPLGYYFFQIPCYTPLFVFVVWVGSVVSVLSARAPCAPLTDAPTVAGGVRARGDAKWPPQEYKTRADEENAQRVALAKGPVCRPRLPKRDYVSFFEQNRVNAMYPGYRAPPGTQHYVDETGVSEF